jgi:transcription-repair coupling factor (superfamily II helicase)
MVTEAVAELKGETPHEPAEVKIEVPLDASLPVDYVEREELRLEAYRRLAAVTSQVEVDDIRTEWEDRFGPIPDPAEALLNVGRLRAECHRLGIVDMQITGTKRDGGQARLSPIDLKLSSSMRLKRMSKGAIHKEDQRQLVVPIPRGQDPAAFLVGFLDQLIPPG